MGLEKPGLFRHYFGDSLPKSAGYVNDFENIYSAGEEKVLDSLIKNFESRTTIQMVIVTIDTAMIARDSFDAFSLRLANVWGVGQKGKNNGVTIVISKGFRRMRIQNGFGIEKFLTDGETKLIIDTEFIPAFRQAKYFEGTFNGLLALMNVLGQRYRQTD